MKLLLLIATLLVAGPGQRAFAQRTLSASAVSTDHPAVAPVDSAAVLHQLFKHSRRIGLLGLIASAGISNGINALSTPEKGRQIIGGVAVGANTGLLVILLVDRLKFSRRREQEAIDQLHRQQPLRPYVQRSYTLALLKATKLPH